MAPIIRLSDSIYKRLEANAIGFDTPTKVIERILEFYELDHGHDSKPSVISNQTDSSVGKPIVLSNSNRKQRDPRKERELKITVGNSLQWGNFHLVSNSLLEFVNSKRKVLCKYSSYSSEQHRWFWGVAQKYWTDWDENFYLALIMENDDNDGYSFLLIKPNDAKQLFEKCSESAGDKKINLRYYKSDGEIHLQEWHEYDIEDRIIQIDFHN